MLLGQIAWVDILVFLIFLAPQLLIQVGVQDLAICIFKVLPFLIFVMPVRLISERFCTPSHHRSPFVQQATLFQDVVIRCVRYAFADIPASIGKVFFSKPVALPFMRFRMLRHGLLKSPIHWEEVNDGDLKGIYAITDPGQPPSILIYYLHGGGFSMGSSYFYLEFLLAWLTLLKEAGHTNPAVFSLEYTLVPTTHYPTPLLQTLSGYKHCLTLTPSPSRLLIAGDSAGATLALALLLTLSKHSSSMPLPQLALLISPWTHILSPLNANTPSDYLNATSLETYGKQYIGPLASSSDPLVSPGECRDLGWWRRASPIVGFYFLVGCEEVFAPEARNLVGLLRKAGVEVGCYEEKGWVHAWPVVKLFLGAGQKERLGGLRRMVAVVGERMGTGTGREIESGKER